MSTTRQTILEAARARFAADGYAAATIRKIAADAGVDAALVIRLFQSKDGLFAAVMSIPPDALTRIAGAAEGPGDSLGERVTRAYLEVWEGDPRDSAPLLAMLRGAIANEQAAAQLRDFIQARLTDGADVISGDDAAFRMALAASMIIGLIVGRRIVGVPELADKDLESIIAAAAPALHQILSSPEDAAPLATPQDREPADDGSGKEL